MNRLVNNINIKHESGNREVVVKALLVNDNLYIGV